MSIQTSIVDARGERKELHPNDPQYWEGPYKYEPYPKMLFRAGEGRYQDDDIDMMIVKSSAEHKAAPSDWKESRDEARAHFDRQEAELARAAAEVKAASLRMTSHAQAELRAAEQVTDEFVTDVTPKKRLGWPKGKPRKKKEPISGESN